MSILGESLEMRLHINNYTPVYMYMYLSLVPRLLIVSFKSEDAIKSLGTWLYVYLCSNLSFTGHT